MVLYLPHKRVAVLQTVLLNLLYVMAFFIVNESVMMPRERFARERGGFFYDVLYSPDRAR